MNVGVRGVACAVLGASLVAGGAARAAVPASAKELGGMRLGMTMEEVKAAAAAHQPPLNLGRTATAGVPGQAGKTFTASVHASTYKGAQTPDFEDFDIYFSPPPQSSRVIGIRRTMGFSAEKAPTQDYLQTNLKEKFGGPPAPDFPGWVWKGDGTAVKGDDARACLMAQGTWMMHYTDNALSPMNYFEQSKKLCGLVAVAQVRPRVVSIDLFDYATLAAASKKTADDASSAAKQKDEAAAAQAKKNRPKL